MATDFWFRQSFCDSNQMGNKLQNRHNRYACRVGEPIEKSIAHRRCAGGIYVLLVAKYVAEWSEMRLIESAKAIGTGRTRA